MENQIEAEPTSYPVLSIDAWADGDYGWNWNSWRYLTERLPAELLRDHKAILNWFAENGLLVPVRGGTYIDDDQYNKVVCDAATGEPLFAVEYGSAY